MGDESDGAAVTTLAPEDAFAALGNETRLLILQRLGTADGPLSFSTLRERVGTRDSGQFGYHLKKLDPHFVRKTDAGYEIQEAGRRVVEAVLSGAITDDPVLETTVIDVACQTCGAPVEVDYGNERLSLFCTECPGHYGKRTTAPPSGGESRDGYLGALYLPPAGIRGRTPHEAYDVAGAWSHLGAMAAASGICPRCSGIVAESVTVCERHDAADGLCLICDSHHAVQWHVECTNCIFTGESPFVMALLDEPTLLAFVAARGLNPIIDGLQWGWEYGEEILSADPFEARFTFTVDGDSITLLVDDSLDVVSVVEE